MTILSIFIFFCLAPNLVAYCVTNNRILYLYFLMFCVCAFSSLSLCYYCSRTMTRKRPTHHSNRMASRRMTKGTQQMGLLSMVLTMTKVSSECCPDFSIALSLSYALVFVFGFLLRSATYFSFVFVFEN